MFVSASVRSHQTLTVTTLSVSNYNLRLRLRAELYLQKYHSRGPAGLVRVVIKEKILKIKISNMISRCQRWRGGPTWYSLKYLVSHLLESEHRFSSGPSITHSDLARGTTSKVPSKIRLTWLALPWLSVDHRWFWLTSEFFAFWGWAFQLVWCTESTLN